ncbi:MAG: hypothetical protein E6J04_10935 [Chloroflexi bacterium]|nr:MAG: hypothetical protein E6J04_10935 [Chloroflexota bacterium]
MDNNSLDIFVECLPVFTVASDNPEGSILEQFLRYRQELLDWNTRMNLTAITSPEEVLIKHFLDSLSLLRSMIILVHACWTLVQAPASLGFLSRLCARSGRLY